MAKIRRCSVDQFAAAVQEALGEFQDYVDSAVVAEAVHKTAEETADVISSAAPSRPGGAYKESITSGYSERRGKKYTETVYAESPGYRLAHLLERSHATRDGGRTREFPHWATGESGVLERLISNIKEALR